MKRITEIIELNTDFPLSLSYGTGWTKDYYESDLAYWHNHACLEINYILEGGTDYYIGEDKYPIEKGDIFLINNYEYHYATNDDRNCRMLVIAFSPELIWQNNQIDYQYIKAFYEWKPSFKHRLPSDSVTKEIHNILNIMMKEWDNQDTGFRLISKSLLLLLLSLLYQKYEKIDQPSQLINSLQNEYSHIVDAINYIDKHFQENITLDYMASMAHMNPSYFSSFFKKNTGDTFSSFVIRKRLSYACLKLITTEDSILHIAIDSGFPNIPYFNRTFKKHFNMTPNEYRHNHQSKSYNVSEIGHTQLF